MQSEEKIQYVYDNLFVTYRDAPEGNDWMFGDNFQYEVLLGKQIALEWVLQEVEATFMLRDNFDFEDYALECKEVKRRLEEALGRDDDNDDEDDDSDD